MMNCPICKTPNFKKYRYGDWFECDRCGTFHIQDDCLNIHGNPNSERWIQVISHYVREKSRPDRPVFLEEKLIQSLIMSEPPYFPIEQSNNIIRWFGNEGQKRQGKKVQPDPYIAMIAIAGAQDREGLDYVIQALKDQDILEDNKDIGLHLTFKGWERYQELQRDVSTRKTAFMAMKFGDKELEDIVENHFRSAVNATGFELDTVKGRAGTITDHIMVDIRLARFIVADLTHGNNGAYWEAGFAEGLEKPVFYTCEKSAWETHKTHFDTNHRHTIIWDKENPQQAAGKLKDAIRNTLPHDAKMKDGDI